MFGFLCVGGPLDGQIKDYNGPFFKANIAPDFSLSLRETKKEVIEVTQTQVVIYVRRIFHTDGELPAYIWIPEKQDMHTTMQKLILGYRPKEDKNV